MKEEYSIFKRFNSLEKALEVQDFLQENGIEAEIGDNAPPVDITFSGSTVMNVIEIRIKEGDFNRAKKLMTSYAEASVKETREDHYLYKFTDEELLEILFKPDEWSEFDYLLAQKILKERGKHIEEDVLNKLRNERNRILAEPEKGQRPWIVIGYVMSVLGGLLGLVIGYYLWTTKKTLPDGQKIYAYSEADRRHGMIIFYIGLIVFPISLVLRLLFME